MVGEHKRRSSVKGDIQLKQHQETFAAAQIFDFLQNSLPGTQQECYLEHAISTTGFNGLRDRKRKSTANLVAVLVFEKKQDVLFIKTLRKRQKNWNAKDFLEQHLHKCGCKLKLQRVGFKHPNLNLNQDSGLN